ncbi:hypothetical protein [Streptomyces sp. NPDC057545]|uniref:hypothetical protein n=1 Tax=Streptomyces sp. NPDC057545 TaxID=3346164 RepID=UPI0036AE695F
MSPDMWKAGFPTDPSLCTDLEDLIPLHTVEITLTQTVSRVELKAARQISGMPMASPPDGKSIAVLVSVQDDKITIRKALRRLQDALPVDVLCTFFPGPDGMLKMSILFTPGRACPPSADDALQDAGGADGGRDGDPVNFPFFAFIRQLGRFTRARPGSEVRTP